MSECLSVNNIQMTQRLTGLEEVSRRKEILQKVAEERAAPPIGESLSRPFD